METPEHGHCILCHRPIEIDNLNGKPQSHKDYCKGTDTCLQRKTRRAAVHSASATAREISALLPENYFLVGQSCDGTFLIQGEDWMGWTLDDYVIPRMHSAAFFAEEVE